MIQCGHRLMATNNNALQGNTKTWCCRIGESSESRAEHWAVVTPQKLCDCMHGHANLWPQNIKKVHMHNTGSVSWANWSSLAQNKNCKWFIWLEIKGGYSPHCCLDSTLQSSPRIGSSLNVTLSIYGCTVIHMVKCTHACYHQLRANHKHESVFAVASSPVQNPGTKLHHSLCGWCYQNSIEPDPQDQLLSCSQTSHCQQVHYEKLQGTKQAATGFMLRQRLMSQKSSDDKEMD